MNGHMNHRVDEIILRGGVDAASYAETLHHPACSAALCHPERRGVRRPHEFYVGVCVELAGSVLPWRYTLGGCSLQALKSWDLVCWEAKSGFARP